MLSFLYLILTALSSLKEQGYGLADSGFSINTCYSLISVVHYNQMWFTNPSECNGSNLKLLQDGKQAKRSRAVTL